MLFLILYNINYFKAEFLLIEAYLRVKAGGIAVALSRVILKKLSLKVS